MGRGGGLLLAPLRVVLRRFRRFGGVLGGHFVKLLHEEGGEAGLDSGGECVYAGLRASATLFLKACATSWAALFRFLPSKPHLSFAREGRIFSSVTDVAKHTSGREPTFYLNRRWSVALGRWREA